MAFKQHIPQEWIKLRPNLAKIPHLYNLDEAVGLGCPNKRLDVMLLQLMLLSWSRYNLQNMGGKGISPKAGFMILPANGIFDNRLLGWILGFQLFRWEPDSAAITGKALPIRGIASLDGRNVIADLNLQIARPDASGRLKGGDLWSDMASAPGTPRELAEALKTAK
jgi:hypothetical protein